MTDEEIIEKRRKLLGIVGALNSLALMSLTHYGSILDDETKLEPRERPILESEKTALLGKPRPSAREALAKFDVKVN